MKICDLMEGVHPGVRASGTGQTNLLADHLAEAFLNNLLDGKSVALALPAAISAAVIFDDQSDVPHLGDFV